TTQSFHCRMSSSAHGLPPTPTFPLSLHAALPIFRNAAIHAIEHGATRYAAAPGIQPLREAIARDLANRTGRDIDAAGVVVTAGRSEEHTSELQSRENLVCRLLLEKKKSNPTRTDS